MRIRAQRQLGGAPVFCIYRDMSGIYHFLINLGGGMVWWYMKVVDEISGALRTLISFTSSHTIAQPQASAQTT